MTPTASVRSAGPLTVGSRLNQILRVGIFVITAAVVLRAVARLLAGFPRGVDIEIPLRAAERWLAGGKPYLPESFLAPPGPEVPFLYPPSILPLVAPFTALPRPLVMVPWMLLLILVAVWTCRRLAIPWPFVPLLLLWPPFFEALLSANVQVILFAAFVAFLYASASHGPPFRPSERDPAEPDRPAIEDGVLATVGGAFKASQAHTWVFLLRRRPSAALTGAAVALGIALATLPFTGVDLWFDWIDQLRRASDPSWPLLGGGLNNFLPQSLGLGLTLVTIVLAAFVPTRHAAAWLGLLMIVGNPSLRASGLLFLLPGMLLIRREITFVAALLAATYTFVGWWAGILLVGGTLALAHRDGRWFEPGADPDSVQLGTPLGGRP